MTVPCALAWLGAVIVVQTAAGHGDPTWNDGDLGIALAGGAALLLLAAVVGAVGAILAPRLELGRGAGAVIVVVLSIAVAVGVDVAAGLIRL